MCEAPEIVVSRSGLATACLTASRALVSNSSGKVAVSAVNSTELGYLDGVTSNIQTQLNDKVPTSRTINGKALSANIALNSSDVGALALTGGTLTGQLTLSRLVANADWPTLAFARSNIEHAFIQTTSTNSLNFYTYATTELEKAETAKKYWTAYALPAPDEGLSGDENFKGKIYNILTTKNTVTIAQGGTGASDSATARANLDITPENIGAVSKSGDTIAGTLIISNGSSWTPIQIKRTIDNVSNVSELAIDANRAYITRKVNNETINYMYLYNNTTVLGKPLTVESGGTGAITAKQALTNLGVIYSATQPAGAEGKIWLKPIN